jgi:hypothetical protein
MKRLFIMDNEGNVDLNKEWLHMIPEFSILLHRVWRCEGDADGRKKLMQRRIFNYIYLTIDFASPLFTWENDARLLEALKSQNLKSGDVEEDKVQAAIRKYDEYQQESSPKLKALRGMHNALDKMNEKMETINLDEVDKQGKPLYTPSTITRFMKEINAAYDALETMERRVLEELKKEGGNTIRGTATLGGKEGKRKEFQEGAGPTQSEVQKSVDKALEEGKEIAVIGESSTGFREMGAILNKMTSEEEEYENLNEEEEGEDDVS